MDWLSRCGEEVVRLNNKVLSVLFLGMAALLVLGTAIYAVQNDSGVTEKAKQLIQQTFHTISNEPIADELLVEGENVEISLERFIFYKHNVELINELNKLNGYEGKPFSDRELIYELIKKDLTVQYAKEQGIEVSEDEVTNYIEEQRKWLYDPNVPGENKKIVQELMANRIKLTGLTEDEYWKSEDTRLEYEKVLYIHKVIGELMEQGKVKAPADFERFQDELLQKHQDKFEVNWSLIRS